MVGVVGPPGIGKSRIVSELSDKAAHRGMEVFTTYCEAHAGDIPFHAVARLLRAVFGVNGTDPDIARTRVRARLDTAAPDDLLLLDELLGIPDPATPAPDIDPDARRRRLTSLINTASLTRTTPTVYVIEDAHWIDDVSDSMLAEFISVIPQTPSLVVATYRPEYGGKLTRLPRSQTIALAPLDDSQTTALTTELLGSDSSIDGLAARIAGRAAGNPFFASTASGWWKRSPSIRRSCGTSTAPTRCTRTAAATSSSSCARRTSRTRGRRARSIALSHFFGQHGYLPDMVDLNNNINMHATFVAGRARRSRSKDNVKGLRAIDSRRRCRS